MTVDDLMDIVEQKTGMPRVFFMDNEGNAVDGSTPVHKTGLKEGSALSMPLPEDEKVTIRQSPDGRSFYLTIDPDDGTNSGSNGKVVAQVDLLPTMTVDDLMDIVEQKTGMPRVFFMDNEGNEVDGSTPVHKTGLKEGSALSMPLPEDEKVTIRQSPDGRSFYLTIDPNDAKDESNGKVVAQIDLLPTMTINDMKDVIEEKTGMPKTQQRVFFFDENGNEMDNNTPVYKTGIKEGSALEVRPPEESKISIRMPDGRSFVLVIDPDDDGAADVRRRLAARLGVPMKELPPLSIDDMELNDDYQPSRGDIVDIDVPLVNVELPDRKKIQLAVLPAQTIGEIKDIIEEETGVKKSDQRIFFFDSNNGEELGDACPLSKTGIKNGSALKVLPPGKEPKEIKVSDPTGRSFTLIIDPDDPVKEVKKRIREKVGFAVGSLKLDDKVWDDDDEDITFEEAGLTRNGILTIEPPEVEIALPNNKKIKLRVMPTMTIGEVKKVIEEQVPEISMKDDNGRMFFLDNDAELDDDTPFQKLNFESGQTIELRSMQVFVKHWSGEVHTIDAKTNWYIGDLKDVVFCITKIPPEQQRILFNDKLVEEHLQLLKQGIVHKSTLLLEQMQIQVTLPSRKKPLSLLVEPTDKVQKVKKRAVKKSKKTIVDPCLVLGGVELENNQSLAECKVQHGDVLSIEEYKISVMHWNGEVFALEDVKRSDTVKSIKEKILREKDIPISDQRLSHNGSQLSDKKSLKKEKVNHKTVLVLEPVDVATELPDAEKKALKQMRTKKFKSKEEEIWPVMPNWERRIFFFDNESDFDAFIELSVMHWSGKQFTLNNILVTYKVNQIKDRIFELHGIDKKKQKLKLDGKLLDGKKTLLEQNVRHKSILTLESTKKNTIENPDLERVSISNTLPAKMLSEITITIKHWKGELYQFHVDPHEYIDDIKDRVLDTCKIPVEDQRLTFNDKTVRDDLNLLEQNIGHGAVLELVKMRVFVYFPSKKKPVSVFVEPDHKIGKIKKALVKKTKTSVDTQCMMFAGEELDDSKTIGDYDIDHDDELKMEVFMISIMHWSGDRFDLDDIGPKSTISDIKEKIFVKKSVPVAKQTLSLHGQVLNDFISIKDQGVKHRSTLIMEPPDQYDDESVSTASVKEKVSFRFFNMSPAINPLLGSSLTLRIKHWNGETFSIEAEASEYIDDIKDKIFDLKKIPVDYQLLRFEGELASDDLDLEEQGIKNNATLVLGLMEIKVETPSGKTVAIELSYLDTIQKAKKLLKKKLGIPVDEQFLMLGSEELGDTKNISDYGIVHQDLLKLETFRVKVADWNGELFDVDGLQHSNTVHELKAKINELKRIPMKEQLLKFDGRDLNDLLGLKDQGIKHRSVLVLEHPEQKSNTPVREKMSFRFLGAAVPSKSQNPIVQPSSLCLHIKHWDGHTFPIKAEPTEYIDDVKEKIFAKKKIPVDKQRLKYNGNIVAGDQSLEQQGIVDNATLVLGTMEVTVQLPNGKNVTVEMNSEDTVIRLKRFLKTDSGVALDEQYLMIGGDLMENTKKLSFYNIEHGDTIVMETFKVSVVDWNGEMFEVDGIHLSSNVSELKSKIQTLKQVPPKDQILKLNGQKLSDMLRLKDQLVKHRSVLVLEPPDVSFLSPMVSKKSLRSIRESEETEDLSESSSTASPTFSPSPVKTPSRRSKKNLVDPSVKAPSRKSKKNLVDDADADDDADTSTPKKNGKSKSKKNLVDDTGTPKKSSKPKSKKKLVDDSGTTPKKSIKPKSQEECSGRNNGYNT